jgi:hypothetical protein
MAAFNLFDVNSGLRFFTNIPNILCCTHSVRHLAQVPFCVPIGNYYVTGQSAQQLLSARAQRASHPLSVSCCTLSLFLSLTCMCFFQFAEFPVGLNELD